ncbi:hypothetical protein ACTQ9L_11160 [Deinococcus wulumuqiensis]
MSRKQRKTVPIAASSDDWVNDYHAGQSDITDFDAFDQNYFDRRDGSYGLHIFREEGQFGSYPVHDDYGDESFAD